MMEFKEIKQLAQETKNSFAHRNQINAEMEKLYWMQWDDEGKVARAVGDIVKITRSPRAANALDGMIRLLCASDPIFSVPNEHNTEITKVVSEKLEKFVTAMFTASGKVTGKPLHYEIVRSAVTFDEIHLQIQSTQELYKASIGTERERAAEHIAQRTPFIFKARHPSEGYPIYDELGLRYFYSSRKLRHIDITEAFGDKGKEVIRRLSGGKDTPFREATLHDVYDRVNRCVWVEGGGEEPLFHDKHGYPFIPIVATTIEGSDLFTEKEKQRHPALYNLYQSGIMERQNLFLTVLYTLLFSIGGSPMWVNYLHNPANPPVVDTSVIGGQINMRVGERREPMAKQVIDPALMGGWEIAQNLEMESTIYRQTLGEPLGANAPYSMVALLSQSGRLPLLMAQRMAGFAIGKAAEIALLIAKDEKAKPEVRSGGIYAVITGKEIPKYFEIEAKLDIAMPQDLLNNVNAAVMATQGDRPLMTVAHAQEKFLQIGQPEEMQRAIWTENLVNLFYKDFTNRMMQAQAQAAQAAQAGPTNMPGGVTGGNGNQPPPIIPPGAPTPSQTEPQQPFPPIQSPYENYPPMGVPPGPGGAAPPEAPEAGGM